jgi:hypothetical protein
MAIKNCDERQVRIVKTASTQTLHLITSSTARGMVTIGCEQAPLLTFQNHGFPARCPVCGTPNPLKGEKIKNV